MSKISISYLDLDSGLKVNVNHFINVQCPKILIDWWLRCDCDTMRPFAMTPAWINNCIDNWIENFSSQMTLNLDGDNDQDWKHMGLK